MLAGWKTYVTDMWWSEKLQKAFILNKFQNQINHGMRIANYNIIR